MEQTLLFAPLAGAIIAYFGWRLIGETAAQWTAAVFVLIAAGLAWLMALNVETAPGTRYLYDWIDAGSLTSALAFRLDSVNAPILVLVASMSALAHVFALAWGAGRADGKSDSPPDRAHLIAGLSAMTFAMFVLIVADDLGQFLAGWMGAGFVLYLLTGFARRKPAAGKAALRVALTLRVGDAALIIVVGALFALADTIRFDDLFDVGSDIANARLTFLWRDWPAAELIGFGLGVAALVMAAQAIFFGWLSDTMEAPTPAAAMIVAAGPGVAVVTLLLRMEPLMALAPTASWWLAMAGLTTTVIAASSAMAQTSPLRTISCLACAQWGFVLSVQALGASDVALLHLLASSLALAALAFGAGVVIHVSDQVREFDRLGGLARRLPLTLTATCVAGLSISGIGVPGTGLGLSGFASLDRVFNELVQATSADVLWLGAIATGCTSFAVWRMLCRMFVAPPRSVSDAENSAESSVLMTVPLVMVAAASAVLAVFFPSSSASFDSWLPVLAALLGLAVALVFYVLRPGWPDSLTGALPWPHKALREGWFLAQLLRTLVTLPVLALARTLSRRVATDEANGNGRGLRLAPVLAQRMGQIQSGIAASYAVAIVIGAVVILLWIILTSGVS